MSRAFSNSLAVHFRERSDTGEWVGGPMYYIKNGLGRRWQFLAVLYALFGVLTVFGTGNATQVNTIVAAVDTALLEYGLVGGSFLPTLNLIVGILVAVLVALVLLAVSPNQRAIEVVYGSALQGRGAESVAPLGVAAAASAFQEGNLIDGLISAIRVMSAGISRP